MPGRHRLSRSRAERLRQVVIDMNGMRRFLLPAVVLSAGLTLATLLGGCRARPASRPETRPNRVAHSVTPKDAVVFAPEPYQPDRRATALQDVIFINERRGWAVGQTYRHWLETGNGILVRTVNGGRDWHSYTTTAWPPLFGVSFADAENGWIVGGQNSKGEERRPRIWHTTDGGATWQPQTAGDVVRLMDVCAVDSKTAFAADGPVRTGDPGRIFATRDGGASWVPTDPTRGAMGGYPGAEESVRLNSVSFSDPRNGWVAGAVDWRNTLGKKSTTTHTQGIILHTSNGGANWWKKDLPFEMTSVSAADSRHIWAVGYESSVLYSNDAGGHWTSKVKRAGLQFFAVRFWDLRHGWIVGSARGGRRLAMYTKNGGRTWTSFVGGKGEYYAVSPGGRPDVAFGVGSPRRIDRIWAGK